MKKLLEDIWEEWGEFITWVFGAALLVLALHLLNFVATGHWSFDGLG